MPQTERRVKIAMVLIMAVMFVAVPGSRRAQSQAAAGQESSVSAKAGDVLWNFDDVPVGKLPAGWRVAATNRLGSLATWQVIEDASAPSGNRVLAMTSPNHTSGGTFNICWTDAVRFLDGEIRVRFKAVRGREDQGGGVMWRVQDSGNYYIARFNPLEDNFRIYYVRNGVRRTLASARVALPAGEWHTLKIVQHGNRFEGYLNGKKFLEGTSSLFMDPGGVGVWTKADAVTSFDDLGVKTEEKVMTPLK